MARLADEQRITKQRMFMEMASVAAKRSTCGRTAVGCVITDYEGSSVVSIGYNGNARGLDNHCDSDTPGECGCIHAEANGLIKAPFHAGKLKMYTTLSPCVDCAKLIINSAVHEVYYLNDYRNRDGLQLLRSVGISVKCIATTEYFEQMRLGV